MPKILECYSTHNADLHIYLSILSLLKSSNSKEEFDQKFEIIHKNKSLGDFRKVKAAIKHSKTKDQIKKCLLSEIRKKTIIIKKMEAKHPEIGMAYNLSMSFMLSHGIKFKYENKNDYEGADEHNAGELDADGHDADGHADEDVVEELDDDDDYDDDDDDSEDDDGEDDDGEDDDEDDDGDNDDDDGDDDEDTQHKRRRKAAITSIDKSLLSRFNRHRHKLKGHVDNEAKFFMKLPIDQKREILKVLDEGSQGTNKSMMLRLLLSDIPNECKYDIVKQHKLNERNNKYTAWLENLLKIPFGIHSSISCNTPSQQKKFLKDSLKNMNEAVYGHTDAKNNILQFLAQLMINDTSKGLILGIEGPMGNGKTTLIEHGISKVLQRPFSSISLGGVSDSSIMDGHSFTYEGSKYGRIVEILMKSKCMNPVIYFDELDKVSETHKGNEIINFLMHLTDPSQNTHYNDHYFSDIPFDISRAIFVFSYNDRRRINPILLDRIFQIKTEGFLEDDKVKITKNHLIKSAIADIGIKSNEFELPEDTIRWIINRYTHEGGVRKLKEIIYEALREINLRKIMNSRFPAKTVITPNLLENDILYHKHAHNITKIHDTDIVGVVNGLYATSNGQGGIIKIEASLHPASNFLDLNLTGMQGDVMKESMNVAKTLAWNNIGLKKQGEWREYWKKNGNSGIHIHCLEGATPKDGPSAGTAITICILSILCGKPIKHDVALTGEIDLHGNILEIGGLTNKLYGAKLAGCKKVLFPKDNLDDFKKIESKHPELFDENFKTKAISTLSEAMSELFDS